MCLKYNVVFLCILRMNSDVAHNVVLFCISGVALCIIVHCFASIRRFYLRKTNTNKNGHCCCERMGKAALVCILVCMHASSAGSLRSDACVELDRVNGVVCSQSGGSRINPGMNGAMLWCGVSWGGWLMGGGGQFLYLYPFMNEQLTTLSACAKA